MKFQTVKGMRDFSPEEMQKRNFVLDEIRKVVETWGYLPIDTPALESFDLLSMKGGGGEEIKKEIYYFKDQGGREIGMRFDLTVPTARFVAGKLDLNLPFKRYQTGKVWRYDNPQALRWREFQQFDVDIFGSNTPESDAEIVALACDVFNTLGFEDFVIKVNNRKLVEAFVLSLGVKDVLDIFRSIDKMDKIGESGVEKELAKKLKNKVTIKKILDFIKIKAKPLEVLKRAKSFVRDKSLDEMERFLESIKNFGYDKYVSIDLSIVRGLEYYTGIVFEVSISGSKLSFASGGRYDNLVEKFGGKSIPALGISFGFDRIISKMEEDDIFRLDNQVKLFIISVNNAVIGETIKICQRFRREGIPTDFDVSGKNLSKQMKYVNSRKIPWVIFVGEKELKENKFKLRDMVCGKEKTASLEELVKEFKKVQ